MTPRKRAVDFADVEAQLRAIERDGGEGELSFGRGETLHVSSLGKTFFPKAGVTKGDLMRYYTRVAPMLLPEIDGRALVLKRYPDGVDGPMFFQQNAGEHVPDVVRVETLDTVDLGEKPRIVGGDLPTLLYTVQLGAIEVHPWLSRVDDVDDARSVPDRSRSGRRCAILAGRGAGARSGAHRGGVRAHRRGEDVGRERNPHRAAAPAAHELRDVGRRWRCGSPRRSSRPIPSVRPWSEAIKARPKGSIYVDALQNARGKSMAAPYSVRAKPAASVSAPLRERELTGRLRIETFTVKTHAGAPGAHGRSVG